VPPQAYVAQWQIAFELLLTVWDPISGFLGLSPRYAGIDSVGSASSGADAVRLQWLDL